jgi:ribosomal protein S14
MVGTRELVLLGSGEIAHLAYFGSRERMEQLLPPTEETPVNTRCSYSGKGHLANGKARLCRRCFPEQYNATAAAWRMGNKHG